MMLSAALYINNIPLDETPPKQAAHVGYITSYSHTLKEGH